MWFLLKIVALLKKVWNGVNSGAVIVKWCRGGKNYPAQSGWVKFSADTSSTRRVSINERIPILKWDIEILIAFEGIPKNRMFVISETGVSKIGNRKFCLKFWTQKWTVAFSSENKFVQHLRKERRILERNADITSGWRQMGQILRLVFQHWKIRTILCIFISILPIDDTFSFFLSFFNH